MPQLPLETKINHHFFSLFETKLHPKWQVIIDYVSLTFCNPGHSYKHYPPIPLVTIQGWSYQFTGFFSPNFGPAWSRHCPGARWQVLQWCPRSHQQWPFWTAADWRPTTIRGGRRPRLICTTVDGWFEVVQLVVGILVDIGWWSTRRWLNAFMDSQLLLCWTGGVSAPMAITYNHGDLSQLYHPHLNWCFFDAMSRTQRIRLCSSKTRKTRSQNKCLFRWFCFNPVLTGKK